MPTKRKVAAQPVEAPITFVSYQHDIRIGTPISYEEIVALLPTYSASINRFVTWEVAAKIIALHNAHNRKIRGRLLQTFIETLLGERFKNAGEPAIFGNDGGLLNAQHRLKAMVESKTGGYMDFRFGIPMELFTNIDTGATRQAGDVLSIIGVKNQFAVAAAVKLALAYEHGFQNNFRLHISNDIITEAYNRWPDISHATTLCKKRLGGVRMMNAASNVFTFLALRQTNYEEAEVQDFLGQLQTGHTNDKETSVWHLREYLKEPEGRMVVERDKARTLAMYIQSWRYRKDGQMDRRTAKQRVLWNYAPKTKGTVSEKQNFPIMTGVNLDTPAAVDRRLEVERVVKH